MTSPQDEAPRRGEAPAEPAPPPGAAEPGHESRSAASALLHTEHDEGPRAGPGVRLAGAVLPLGIGLVAAAFALQQGVGGPRDPGAGMWPLLTSVAIIGCALALLFTERTQLDYEKYTRGALQNMVGLASLVGFVLLLPRVGIELATLLVTGVWLKYLGGESWRTTVIMSLAITVGVYVLFISVLGAPIPRRLAI